MSLETRTLELFGEMEPLEFRAAEGDKPAKLSGYAAVFNSLSANMGGFKERIKPGAFRASIDTGRDVRALVDHDPSKLLGRTLNRTLRLGENEKGLWVEIDVPTETSYGRDIMALVKRGDIRGMSFGFLVAKGGDRFVKEEGLIVREMLALDLREVTVTSLPAYGDTSLSIRVDPEVAKRFQTPDKFPRLSIAKRRLQLT